MIKRGGLFFYILKDKKPVPCTLEEYETMPLGIAWTKLPQEEVAISTVFLSFDHNFHTTDDYVPLLFETMIFGGKHDHYQRRCATYDEALVLHEEAVRIAKGEAEKS